MGPQVVAVMNYPSSTHYNLEMELTNSTTLIPGEVEVAKDIPPPVPLPCTSKSKKT